MYIENACYKVIVEQRTRLFAAVLFFYVNLREKMFDIPASVIHLQYVPNGYFYFYLKVERWSWHSSASRQVFLQVLVKAPLIQKMLLTQKKLDLRIISQIQKLLF